MEIKDRIYREQICTEKNANMFLGFMFLVVMKKYLIQSNVMGKCLLGLMVLQGIQFFIASKSWQQQHGTGLSHCINSWEAENNRGEACL